jgi:PAS domain S-box-containing protein
MARLSEYTQEELVGQSPRIFASGKQSTEYFQEMWATLLRGDVWKGQIVSKRKDGSLFTQETTTSPVRDADDRITHYVSVGRDVTQEAELEARLRQSQKLEAMGTLAGGIAHDFNNLLQAMLGYADLVKSDLPANSPTMEFIDQVIGAGDRAVELVAQILAFSRQTDREHRPLQLQSLVKETLKLLRPTLPSTIAITQVVDGDCAPILADATEVHQAIMNLCTNAFHAMRVAGGTLSVQVEQVSVDGEVVPEALNLSPGTYARLTVADTGVGMDRYVLARAFDPFFTTKPVGEGTGMGLATVLGIAEKAGGTVIVESEPGVGSVFHMYWPVVNRDVQTVRSTTGEDAEFAGTERLLLVDDEELVLKQVKAGLERIGYCVDAHTSSLEAFATFDADPHCYHAVITDQTMPGITGFELARKILARKPGTPVILCSGFSELVDEARAKNAGIRGFVKKPMLTTALAGEIRRAINYADED